LQICDNSDEIRSYDRTLQALRSRSSLELVVGVPFRGRVGRRGEIPMEQRFYRDEESNYAGRRRRDASRRPSQHRHGYRSGDEEEINTTSVSSSSSPREIIFHVGKFSALLKRIGIYNDSV